MPRPGKLYDRAYFERWYRDPRYAVVGEGVRARRVQLAVAVTEYLLERPLRTVLDVGCGEGAWQPLLRMARPNLRYLGVDSSEYAVKRFGVTRNLRLGSLATLHRMKLQGPFDLIVCSDVLHYVNTDEMRRGLKTIAALLGAVAFLELYTSEDETEGDGEGLQHRSPALYRRALKQAGLIHLGMHCYAGVVLADQLITFERAER